MTEGKGNLGGKISDSDEEHLGVRLPALLKSRARIRLAQEGGGSWQTLIVGLLREWVDRDAPLPAVPELPNDLEAGLSEEDVQILHNTVKFLRKKKTSKEDKRLMKLLQAFFEGSE